MSRSADAEDHGAQRSLTFWRVNRYSSPNFTWPSGELKNSTQRVSLNGFPWRPAAFKPYINARHQTERSKARCRWTLEQWSLERPIRVCVWWLPGTVLVQLHCARCKVWWRWGDGAGRSRTPPRSGELRILKYCDIIRLLCINRRPSCKGV